MRTFKNKAFVRFANKAEIGDAELCEAIRAAERGLIGGFAKNEMDNIRNDELVALKKLASELLAFDDKTIARVVASGRL